MFGVNLLKDLRTEIDLHNNRISFYDNLVFLPITKSLDKSVVLSTVSAVTIYPRPEAVIAIRFQGRFNHTTAIVEPLPQLQSKHMLGARSIVQMTKNEHFVTFLTLEKHPSVFQNTNTARLSPVDIPANVQQTAIRGSR